MLFLYIPILRNIQERNPKSGKARTLAINQLFCVKRHFHYPGLEVHFSCYNIFLSRAVMNVFLLQRCYSTRNPDLKCRKQTWPGAYRRATLTSSDRHRSLQLQPEVFTRLGVTIFYCMTVTLDFYSPNESHNKF